MMTQAELQEIQRENRLFLRRVEREYDEEVFGDDQEAAPAGPDLAHLGTQLQTLTLAQQFLQGLMRAQGGR